MKHRVNRMMAVAVLTGGLLFAGTGVSAATFKDLNKEFWAKDEISYLVENEIIKGYPDGTFNPNKTITKAQGATMLVRALNLQTTNNPDPGFSDVAKNHSAYKEIAAAVAAGIFDKGGKFNPNEELTREAVAIAIYKAFKLQNTGEARFTDVPTTSSAYKAIASLAEHDITTGHPDGTFKPHQKVTRAQFSAFVARALSTDFLPSKYNVPLNVNPAATLFHMALKKPDEAQGLFVDRKFNISVLTKDVRNFELIEVKEVARANGHTEFLVKFKAELKKKANNSLLKDGENQLYVVIKRNGYMNFKIVSISKDPQLAKDQAPSLTEKEALGLFKQSQNSYWYVVMGGEGKRNDATFTHKGKDYRYMAESLNTMEKLKTYLGKTYTSDQVTALIKELEIIEHKGVLAQPNADGGSILNWEKATIKETASTATSKKFTLNVPLGDTKEVEKLQGELRYEKGKGWRVYSLDTILNDDTPTAITPEQALGLFVEAKNSYWNVVSGGEGKRNEATFTHKGMEYRYLAESLNTMEKLKTYLGKTYTSDQVATLIKKLDIIEHKGMLAQPNADGGSRLMFEKATIKETASTATSKKFTLNVPLYGDGNEVDTLQGELRYEKDKGWRVYSLETILNDDTPTAVTPQQALELFKAAKNSYWYVVMGGEGKQNEERFKHKGKDYRYMAESLNTMEKLKKYLATIYTPEQQKKQLEKLVKELGIIEHKGVLAQPDADGGSILNWDKAKIKETSGSNQGKHFEIDVPIGESSEYEALIGELRYVKEAKAWLVHDLDQRMSVLPKK